MTSVAGYPGVAAVVLNREELDRDDEGMELHYERIKVLTDEGRKYATVELKFVQGQDWKQVAEVAARVIHADGKVVPFAGKPFMKDVAKGGGYKLKELVIELPDVQVGSILEYSYSLSYGGYAEPPDWEVQMEIPQLKALFLWEATRYVRDSLLRPLGMATWGAFLPPEAAVVHYSRATSEDGNPHPMKPPVSMLEHDLDHDMYVLQVANVAPLPKESFMPPPENARYGVRFNYVRTMDVAAYWANEMEAWSDEVNSFCKPNDAMKAAAAAVVGESTDTVEKLRKIYVAVMALDNTDYSRERAKAELKAAGFGR